MAPDGRSTRRRVVQLAGVTATTVLLAGCGGPGTDDDDPEFEEGTGNGQDIEDTDNESGNETDDGNDNETGGNDTGDDSNSS